MSTPLAASTAVEADRPSDVQAEPQAPSAAATSELEALLRRLEAEPWEFDFFQVLRRIEATTPHLPRIGRSMRRRDDALRFGQAPSLVFAPSTLASLKRNPALPVPQLLVHCFGLLGPNGPMPLHFSEYIYSRVRQQKTDQSMHRFLDLFHHRFITLFYRAWATNFQAVSADRPAEDRFAWYVASLIGYNADSLRDRDAVPDMAKLHFAGHLAAQTRHAVGLASILQEDLGSPAEVVPFIGKWIDLPQDCRCRVGETKRTGTLGQNCFLGERVWDCQQKFRVVLGPMTFERYERLLPGGPAHQRLRDWIRNYAGDALEWEANLIVARKEARTTQLGRQGRLGWSTWVLPEGGASTDRGDLMLQHSARLRDPGRSSAA